MNDEEFYRRCAELLGTTYDCEPFPYHRRTRWNNRAPGGGRFPGHGLIRLFGARVQIALHHPVVINANVDGRQSALDFLLDQIVTPAIAPAGAQSALDGVAEAV